MAKVTLEIQNGELVSPDTMASVFTYGPLQLPIKYVTKEENNDRK